MIKYLFKNNTKIAVLTALTLIILSSTCWAATYYIDPNVGNGGNGTEQNPFNQWSDVTWAAGNTYLQKRGTTSTSTVNVGASGTSANWITLGAYGTGNRPVISVSTGGRGININNISYVKVQDLHVTTPYKGSGAYLGWGIATDWDGNPGAHDVIIEGCEVGPTYGHGIVLNNLYNVIVRNNIMHGSGTGLSAADEHDENNIMLADTHNFLVEHNVSYDCVWGAAYDSSDFTVNSTGISGTFRYNIGYNSYAKAMFKLSAWNTSSVVNVYNNLMYNGLDGIGFQENLEGNIYNNTIYNMARYGIEGSTEGDNVNFKNNIIHTSLQAGVHFNNSTMATFDNNIVYNWGAGVYAYVNGRSYSSLAALQAGTNYCDNCSDADPLFTNSAGNDFTLSPGSPGRNAGADVSSITGLTKDIVNTPIALEGVVDIGAYEYTTGIAGTPRPVAPSGLRIL